MSDMGDLASIVTNIYKPARGVVVTNNKFFAERIKLIRNHAEAIVEKEKLKKLII